MKDYREYFVDLQKGGGCCMRRNELSKFLSMANPAHRLSALYPSWYGLILSFSTIESGFVVFIILLNLDK